MVPLLHSANPVHYSLLLRHGNMISDHTRRIWMDAVLLGAVCLPRSGVLCIARRVVLC